MFLVPPGKKSLVRILPAVLAVLLAWALPALAMEVMDAPELTEVSARTGVTINIPQANGISITSDYASANSFLAFHNNSGVPGYLASAWITLDNLELYQYNSLNLADRNDRIPINNMTLDAMADGVHIGLPAFTTGISLSCGALKVGNAAEAGSSFGRFEIGNMVMPAGTLTLSGGGYTDTATGIQARLQSAISTATNQTYFGYYDNNGTSGADGGWLVLGGLVLDRGTGYADFAPVDIYAYADLGTDTAPNPDKTYARFMLPEVGGQPQQFRLRAVNIGLGADQTGSSKLMEMGMFLRGSIQLNVTNYTVGATRYETFLLGNGSGGRFANSYLYIYDSDDHAYTTSPGYIVFNNAYLTGSGGAGTDGSLDGITLGSGNNGGVYIFGGDRPTASVIDCGFDLQTSSTNNFAALGNANTLFGFRGDNVTFPAMQMYFNPVNNTGIRLTGSPFFRLGDKTQVNRLGGIYDADGETAHSSTCTGAGYWVLDQFDFGLYGTINLNVSNNYAALGPAARLTSTDLRWEFYSNSFFNNALNKGGIAKEFGILDISIPFNDFNATIRAH